MDEKIMNITLKKTKAAPRSKKAKRAINEIREHVVRHMKAKEDDIWIDHRLNEAIWVNGIQRPPLKITVKAVKFEDALVEVSLPEHATVEEYARCRHDEALQLQWKSVHRGLLRGQREPFSGSS
jgi:large subunit ribosomal protein L31e